MRLRRWLCVCILVLVMPLIGLAQMVSQEVENVEAGTGEKMLAINDAGAEVGPAAASATTTTAAALVPPPLEIGRKDGTYKSAYHDVYHILSGPNPCSSFFGGPQTAVEVLNNLFSKLEVTRLPNAKVSMTMFGRTHSVRNARTGASYRLFERAVINTTGPFYQKKFSPSDPFVPNVGSFQPNTREARAAILLHEMGHLLQGPDGEWLLPNDGTSDEQSRKNTAEIEKRCGEQIKELQRKRKGTESLVPAKGGEPTGSR